MAIQDIKSKINDNKQEKERKLLNTALHLFTEKGIKKTSIQDIVHEAGIAKGTFYLYFKDKYDLRDKLIAFKASQLFDDAHKALDAAVIPDFEEEILFVTDYIIERFQNQQGLMKFLSKNLSWGVFQDAVGTGSLVSQKFYNHYLDSLQRYHVECSSPKLLLFTLIEFISSTSYNCILHNEPVSMEEYMPYMHAALRQICKVYITETPV